MFEALMEEHRRLRRQVASLRAEIALARLQRKYREDQVRDENGRWVLEYVIAFR